MAWPDTFLKVLKHNDVQLVAYVPDNVLTPLIAGVAADNDVMPVCAAREDEALTQLGPDQQRMSVRRGGFRAVDWPSLRRRRSGPIGGED